MNGRITIKEALGIWSREIIAEKTPDAHIAPPDLYELVIQTPSDEIQDSVLNHLSRCALCVQVLKDMVDSVEEAEMWDLALPKAAAAEEIRWPKKIPTEGGKYAIEIRRSITEDNKGLVTVYVQPRYVDSLEGKQVILKDGRGRILLGGVIIAGKVSQEIENLAEIVPRFTVEPSKSFLT